MTITAQAVGERGDPRRYDVVVVGSGVAGLTAAVTAAMAGLKVVVLEKTAFVGGTTAWSGGIAWVPNNDKMAAAGRTDSREQARAYVMGVTHGHANALLLDRFLQACPEAFAFLEKHTTAVRFISFPGVDYYQEVPGATSHRGLLTANYDGMELGDALSHLRPQLKQLCVFDSMQVDVMDIFHLQHMHRSWKSMRHGARLIGRYMVERLSGRRGTRLIRGNALAARLYRSALDAGVTVERQAPVIELVREAGRVVGVVVERDGQHVQLSAARGVVLASGGLSANETLRRQYMPFADQHLSMLPEGNTGDGIGLALANGAQMGDSKPSNGCLVPMSATCDAQGRALVKYPHIAFDRCKPGSLIVDKAGRRFTNEAGCYHDVVKAMQVQGAVPAFLIGDAPFIRRYGMGLARPRPYRLKPLIDAGYLVEAPTLESLAAQLGIDAAGLRHTVAQMNRCAQNGADPDFGRGGSVYNRSLGDAAHAPNPCLGPIDRAPFYAIRLYPGDLGTFVGLQINADGQVLDTQHAPIPGLYAAGLDIESVFGGFYPGAGSMHGPNVTFAYLAARHIVAAEV